MNNLTLLINCKVSSYLGLSSEKFIHNNGINIQTPDFIFINMSSKQSSSSSSSSSSSPPTTLSCNNESVIVDQIRELFPILQNIKELQYGTKPTILWDGSGFEIYQPVQTITLDDIAEEYIDLEHLEEFRTFVTQQQLLSSLFFEFSKQRVLREDSNRSYPSSISYKFSYMLPIQGTLNSKYVAIDDEEKSKIQIAQTWDGSRPRINLLLSAFQAYLTFRKNIKKRKEKKSRTQYSIIAYRR
jgi:hypothetical protein